MALVSSKRLHSGRVIDLDLDTVRFPDGSTGELEMVRHSGAAAVLPFLDEPSAADPRVIMIRQFRHAADAVIWEIPAGRLDAGEAPEACARRELLEETGYRAAALAPLTTIFTTPGFTDERIHLFTATGLTAGDHAREADEFVEVREVRWSALLDLVRDGAVSDAKTLAAILFVQSFARR